MFSKIYSDQLVYEVTEYSKKLYVTYVSDFRVQDEPRGLALRATDRVWKSVKTFGLLMGFVDNKKKKKLNKDKLS